MTFINVAGAPQPVDSVLVKRVHVTNRARGVAQGAGIGVLAGAFVGFMAVISDPPEDDLVFSKEEAMVLVSITSAVIGAVIGGVAGQQTEYVFDDRP